MVVQPLLHNIVEHRFWHHFVARLTALQALALWNDKFMVRQCEHLAERAARESPASEADQVDALFRWIVLRAPTVGERQRFTDFASRHGVANVARVLLNTSEFVFVD